MSDGAPAPPANGAASPDPLVGRVVGGRFRLTALIARGGMGKVYRAEQAPLGRTCAVKILNPGYAREQDPEFHKRFFLEASVLAKLTHPNTVTVFDYGRTDDDVYYMAMEYLDGQTLHRAIREAGHLPEERAAHVARQICRALREAHSLGIVHRDLKPANIFLARHGDESDFVKVLDFGLLKNVAEKGEDLTQTGMFMGSPKYMSPEQIRGDRIDARTDVYALGIILYEMLTGKVPFDRPTSVNILMAHVHEAAPPMSEMNAGISLSPAIEQAVARCLEKDPDRRFRSMEEALNTLKLVGAESILPPVVGRFDSGGSLFPGMREPGRSIEPLSRDSRASRVLPAAASHAPTAAGVSKRALGLAGAGIVAISGAATYFAVHSKARPAASITAASTATEQARVPAQPAATAPSAGSVVKVHVNTEPDGASVRDNGVEVCESTPCELTYAAAPEGEAATEHQLTLAKPGYRAEVRSISAGAGDTAVRIKLMPNPAPHAAPRPADAPPAVPPGYKTDIPY